MKMTKIVSLVATCALIVGAGVLFFDQPDNPSHMAVDEGAENVELRDGIQYVTIMAEGGYFPKVTQARAHLPTKLIVKTKGTYDCSTALMIRSMSYQKILPPVGEEIIDLGVPQPGKLEGLCSMGMYSFTVDFR